MGAKGFNFDAFLMPFGPPFSINLPDRPNLLICNSIMRKLCFTISGIPFWHQISKNKNVFQITLLDIIFLIFLKCFKKINRCWDSFTNKWAPNRKPTIDNYAKMVSKTVLDTHSFVHRKTQIHAETPSGLNLRCFYIFLF